MARRQTRVTYPGKITTRLRPDVNRRLRATAILRGARISHLINDALDAALPSLPQIRALLADTLAPAEEAAHGDRA